MKQGVIPLVVLILMATLGCVSRKDIDRELSKKPQVTEWEPGEKFVTTASVQPLVEQPQIGRVSFVRADKSGNSIFTALVIPCREIPIGTLVRVDQVSYLTTYGFFASEAEFLLIH